MSYPQGTRCIEATSYATIKLCLQQRVNDGETLDFLGVMGSETNTNLQLQLISEIVQMFYVQKC